MSGVTIDFTAGRTTALIGPSGAGKSTILNLIPRFYDPIGGRILSDGQEVAGVTTQSLRQSIALVSQEVTMFNDTVRANIAYGRLDADETAIIEAATIMPFGRVERDWSKWGSMKWSAEPV